MPRSIRVAAALLIASEPLRAEVATYDVAGLEPLREVGVPVIDIRTPEEQRGNDATAIKLSRLYREPCGLDRNASRRSRVNLDDARAHLSCCCNLRTRTVLSDAARSRESPLDPGRSTCVAARPRRSHASSNIDTRTHRGSLGTTCFRELRGWRSRGRAVCLQALAEAGDDVEAARMEPEPGRCRTS